MLDAHPALAIPPETHFAPELIAAAASGARRPTARGDRRLAAPLGRLRARRGASCARRLEALDPLDAAGALRAFYGLYAERAGKPRWGDKTPIYVEHMREIAGRAAGGALHPPDPRRPRRRALADPARARRAAAGRRRLAKSWQRRIAAARKQARRVDHYIELRYEDLVADTEPTLRRVCELIELDFDAGDARLPRARRRAAGRDRARPAGAGGQGAAPGRGAHRGARARDRAAAARPRSAPGARRWRRGPSPRSRPRPASCSPSWATSCRSARLPARALTRPAMIRGILRRRRLQYAAPPGRRRRSSSASGARARRCCG